MKYEPYTINDVKKSAERKLFTVISTFAGGGGSSTGYKLAGGDILCINEFVESALDTYFANYDGTLSLDGDIHNLTGYDFLDMAGLERGELDLLDGSPPCSAFSIAGRREKGWGTEKKYSEDKTVKNVEDLFFEFIRVANDIQPRVIIGENVKSIMFGKAKEYFNRIINGFQDIGYTAVGKSLNAADFGTPQARERCFFIAIRNDVLAKTSLNFMTLESIYPEPTHLEHVSLYEAINDVENDPNEVEELYEAVKKGFLNEWIPKLPKYPDRQVKGSEYHPNQSLFNLIRPCADLPSPTITQQGQQKGLSGVIHYAYDRKLTIPELKRVQGLPEDFRLEGTFNQKAERIGRMVAPKCIASLATSVYNKVLSYD
ncbi:MAG: DNA cytosine methyltransferase [Candidatus Pacebacteria bacterium]|nr:DNA cytosine methyltransferase [Candidatus Paceibacterota bacterium]